jgi:hypothetical protein
MRKDADARREETAWYVEHDETVARLQEAISKTIKFAIRDTSTKQLAEEVHYARTTLCTLLNQKASDDAPQRNWTLSLLLAISKALGIKLSALIAEAEEVMEGSSPGLQLRIAATEPRSRERLQKLIYTAVDYSGDIDAKHYDGLLEVLYRVKDIEYAVPSFWKKYQEGFLSDQEALAILKSANERVNSADGEAPPFWEALRQVWNEKENEA